MKSIPIAAVFVTVGAILGLTGCGGEAPPEGGGIEVPGVGDPVSDTGYVGSWMRGNDSSKSLVMIVHDGERFRFRWLARSSDGAWRVDCDWDGNCEEFADDVKVADHVLRVREESPDGRLIVEKTSIPAGDDAEAVTYVDEWVLADDGLSMRYLALRRADEVYDAASTARPRGRLSKISDRVADAPSGPAEGS